MRLLVVDDEKNIRASIVDFFRMDGIETAEAQNGLAAQKLLMEQSFDGIVLDLRMPGMDGLTLLRWLREEGRQTPVVMISAYGEIDDAVSAMKQGAGDYLVKPFDPAELLIRVRRAVEDHALRTLASLRSDVPSFTDTGNGAMREIGELIQKVAPKDATVLITGESGTGKEVLARRIHALSRRADRAFVPINIGGVPETLVESELFGYERGAFTGAEQRKRGMFEVASSGTLFLDEIGDMPMQLQVKLLRVIQDRKIQRLGGTVGIPVDVRLIAATNADLEQRVADGTFREDLFYRLNVIRIEVPPLRDRPDDIPLLARHFLTVMRERTGSRVTEISPEALRKLQTYRFPGNVREMENMIERAVILTDNEVLHPSDFPLPSEQSGNQMPTGGSLRVVEEQTIRAALLRNEWHRQRAADELGISRRTLLNKIKQYRIHRE
ncbi:MAG: sigma-54-dependent Fis family transcriptional regulator [Spirochaetaceae bacterium]|nr:MAG: sigma-54-dependent Fis family transcriptional regulator [Spirochaetaceae bacterium]